MNLHISLLCLETSLNSQEIIGDSNGIQHLCFQLGPSRSGNLRSSSSAFHILIFVLMAKQLFPSLGLVTNLAINLQNSILILQTDSRTAPGMGSNHSTHRSRQAALALGSDVCLNSLKGWWYPTRAIRHLNHSSAFVDFHLLGRRDGSCHGGGCRQGRWNR